MAEAAGPAEASEAGPGSDASEASAPTPEPPGVLSPAPELPALAAKLSGLAPEPVAPSPEPADADAGRTADRGLSGDAGGGARLLAGSNGPRIRRPGEVSAGVERGRRPADWSAALGSGTGRGGAASSRAAGLSPRITAIGVVSASGLTTSYPPVSAWVGAATRTGCGNVLAAGGIVPVGLRGIAAVTDAGEGCGSSGPLANCGLEVDVADVPEPAGSGELAACRGVPVAMVLPDSAVADEPGGSAAGSTAFLAGPAEAPGPGRCPVTLSAWSLP